MTTHTVTLAILALVFGVAGCDKPAPAAGSSNGGEKTKSASSPEAKTGKFSLDLNISASQDVYKLEGAPKPDEVQARLTAAIYATEAFEKGGPRVLKGLINYDIKMLPDDAGYDVVLLGGLNSPGANFDAGVNLQSTDAQWQGKSVEEMVDGTIAQFAERIGAQARVIGGDDDNLRAVMENDSEPDSARLMAIQEVRERRLAKYADIVRTFLTPERSPKFRLAASATLVSLGDTESSTEILKVAEDFSRDRNPQFIPMLHILSDLGGDEVMTYLETVAEAHAAPAVRSVATEALEKARARGPRK